MCDALAAGVRCCLPLASEFIRIANEAKMRGNRVTPLAPRVQGRKNPKHKCRQRHCQQAPHMQRLQFLQPT